MAWLIGVVCIILVVRFWRIFLPLAVLAGVVLGVFIGYLALQDRQRQRQQEASAESVRAKLRASADGVARRWEVVSERDPASGELTPRTASVASDNANCRLQVEQRLNTTRLTGIYCAGLKVAVSYPENVQVKFDNRPTSDPMQIQRLSDGDAVYIGSRQDHNALQYDEFLTRIGSAQRVAIQLRFTDAGDYWQSFSLEGADEALLSIGAAKPPTQKTQLPTPAPRPSVATVADSRAWLSRRAWAQLVAGMQEPAVKSLLGEPTQRMTINGSTFWYYGDASQAYVRFVSDYVRDWTGP